MLLFFLTLIGFWMGGEAGFHRFVPKSYLCQKRSWSLGLTWKGLLTYLKLDKVLIKWQFSLEQFSILILNIYCEWIISDDGYNDMIDSYFSSNQPSVSKAFWLTDERAYTTGHQNQQSIMVMLLRLLLLLLLARMCDKKEHKQNNNWCKKNHDHKQWLKKYHWLISDACLPLLIVSWFKTLYMSLHL